MEADGMSGFSEGYGKSRLATVMQEVSYGCSIDAATFRGMLQSVKAHLDEQTAAEVLGMMAQTTPAAFPGSNSATLLPEQLAALSATLAAIANGGISPNPGAAVPGDGSNAGVVGWAWKVVLDVFRSVSPSLNWASVAEHLDHPSFGVPSSEGFQLLVHAYRYGAGEQLPVKAVVGRKWDNEMGQLSLLKFAVLAPPEIFSFQASERKVPPVEGLHGGKSPVGTANQAWLSVDLLQIMCHFTVDAAKRPTVLGMLEHPIKFCPEVLLLAMAAVPEDMPILQREVYSILLPPYLKDAHVNAQLVLQRLWQVNPKLVKEMLLEYYLHDKEHLPRIHDICQELKVLPEVLRDTPSCRFALHLAVYAYQVKQSISLEQWAATRLSREPVTLVYEVMLFLYAKAAALQSDPVQTRVLGRLSDDTLHALLRFLLPLRPQLAGDFLDGYNQLADLMAKAHPAFKQSLQGPLFAADTELEAKGYLQRLYTRTATWEEVFAHVQKLRGSANQRDQDIFACFAHHLLSDLPAYLYDEYKELQGAAMLVSALVTQQLLPNLLLGMALRFVLFALRQPLSSRPFTFGLAVLRIVAARATRSWSVFCEQVLLTPQVREADPELFTRVEASMHEFQAAMLRGDQVQTQYAMLPAINLPLEAGQVNMQLGGQVVMSPSKAPMPAQGQSAQDGQAPPGLALSWTGGAAAGNQAMLGASLGAPLDKGKGSLDEVNDIEGELESTLLAAPPQAAVQPKAMLNVNTVSLENASEKHAAPSEQVQDNIHFTINNLSQDNVDHRAVEVRAKVVPDFRGWFCEYMAKRAAQEHNYQPLYLRMMDKMADHVLFKQLVKSTYFYVRLLLTGDRAVKESNDRQLLKNLGHWLGHLTLKRNKPLLSRELELKQIVVEAYQRGRLVSVLPFVANLLSVCEKSQVFTPTNPMISGLLSLLAELHKLPQLKFNGQYCIEMVFKTFGNPTVEPTNLLASLPRDTLNNADFSNVAEDNMDRGLMSPEATSNMQQMMNAAAVKAFSQNVVGTRTPAKAPGMVPGVGNGMPAAAPTQPGMAPTPVGQQNQQQVGTMPPGTPGMAAGQQSAMSMAGMLPGEVGKQEGLVSRPPGAAPNCGAPAAAGPPPSGIPPNNSPPQPTGLCMEHNAMIQFLSQNAVINPSLGAIAERLQLKRHVPIAIERAIWEILNPVVERSVTIACSTTCELLAKDFALDGDETRMRKAAHLMVSSLAGSLALVTCKDPLRIALTNQLSQLASAQGAAAIEKSMLEQVVTVVVQDNLEACCQVFERAATDKAVRDADKQLQDKYDERMNAKKLNRPFTGDTSAFHGRFPQQLPESLRPRPGVVSAMQLRVYEDFARIPRAPPPAAPALMPGMRPYTVGDDGLTKDGSMSGVPGMQGAAANALLEAQYLNWQSLVDNALLKGEASGDQSELGALMQELIDFHGASAPEEAGHLFVQRIFRHLFEVSSGASKLAVNFYCSALQHVANALVNKGGQAVNLTAMWLAAEDDRKFSRDALEGLLRMGLLHAMELDTGLARALGRSAGAAELVVHLVKSLMLQSHLLAYPDLAMSIDALGKMAMQLRAGGTPAQVAAAEQHLMLVEQARRASPPALQPQRAPGEIPACVQGKVDTAGAKEQVLALFDEWLRLSNSSPGFATCAANPNAHGATDADRAALLTYLANLRASGWIKDEASSERWVRLCIDLAINHSQSIAEQGRGADGPLLYLAVDGLARLLACVTVHGAGLPFLRSALAVLVGVIKRDADERSVSFNGRPYLRLLVGLMAELPGGNTPNSSSPEALDPMALRYLRAIAEALHALQPLSVPGWAFCWLTAVAHRSFMPRLLLSPTHHGWLVYEHLLVALLKFLEPYLRSSSELTECVRALYKGTLRLLLVLLHDFPEFLCEHHFPLCDVIPVSCVQLRNLVLSAFPRSMRLPDPFTPGLKVDLLPEIMQPPRVLPEPERLLEHDEELRASVDSFLRTRTPASLPLDLARSFKAAPSPDGKAYNTSLINAVVLYIGAASRSSTSPADGPAMDIFLRLMEALDSQGRYLVLNAAANQLRYPNSHTYYFSCMLLTLFAEVKAEVVKEQITRVLLERLVVNRPHPWGLLITFIELIKNQRYQFWDHGFTRNGSDVERLFKNVAASCMAHGTAQPTPASAATDAKEGDDGVRA